MRTNIIKIGNSRGVILPSKMLKALKVKDSVDMEMRANTIIIHGSSTMEDPFEAISHGGWYDDPRDAHEISRELEDSRVNDRSAIEL